MLSFRYSMLGRHSQKFHRPQKKKKEKKKTAQSILNLTITFLSKVKLAQLDKIFMYGARCDSSSVSQCALSLQTLILSSFFSFF